MGGPAFDYRLRPLRHDDVGRLADFYESLSSATRRFWLIDSFDERMAAEHCAAIGRYDKLRLVAEDETGRIDGLFEFSFDLPTADIERFATYGITLRGDTDVRFGPCMRDAVQGTGVAQLLLEPALDCARRVGRSRVLLWGGVHENNLRARRFYERNGFAVVGAGAGTLDMMRGL